jgi:hypothetical protein
MKAWRKHNQKHRRGTPFHLRTKQERRGQFAAEVSSPSQLVYILFAHVGLPVPPEFIDYVRSRSAASNPST